MYFSSTPKTYEPEESDLENAYYLKIHDNILLKVTATKFLGVIIDDRLSWDYHIKTCIQDTLSSRALGLAAECVARAKVSCKQH